MTWWPFSPYLAASPTRALPAGAKQASTPGECVAACDITFACLTTPEVCLEAVNGAGGVLSSIGAGKSYVDCSTVDEETSQKIADAVTAAGGRFLEAPVSGSKKPAEDGQLIFLTAGDESLYHECKAALEAMGKKHLFLGKTGAGARMKLVVNMVMGSMMNAFAEGMALSDAAGLKSEDLLDVLDNGAMSNPMFRMKGPNMAKGSFPTAFPLKHQQKDMRLALALGDKFSVGMPVAAAANESFKKAMDAGKSDDDFSAVLAVIKQ
ncbi:MAG: NAD(P)-dependent oxidoreductase [Promethearchaeia archaeon]